MKTRFILFALAALLVVSCKKDDTTPPVRGKSYLHIVGGASGAGTFRLNFNYYNVSNLVIGDFYHLRNWPLSGYAELEEGGKPDAYGNGKIWAVCTNLSTIVGVPDDTIMQPRELQLVSEEKSTLCFADSMGAVVMKKFTDTYVTPDSGFAAVRFINLDQNVPASSLTSLDNTIQLNAVAFLGASTFQQVPVGTHDFVGRDDATMGIVASLTNFTFSSRGVYTFYMSRNTGGGVLAWFRH